MTDQIPDAWKAIAKIYTQKLCVSECEWLTAATDPYGTGDNQLVVHECTVPTPRQCPAFKKYCEEHS
jgi:hypothetical protein